MTMDAWGFFAEVPTVKKEEMLEKSDYITIHVPFSGGKPILGKDEINRMKDGVVLINTSRGGAIDENALLEGLESGKIKAAGLDVFENEPSPNEKLLSHERVSVSPHIGASTEEAQSNIGVEMAEAIISYFQK